MMQRNVNAGTGKIDKYCQGIDTWRTERTVRRKEKEGGDKVVGWMLVAIGALAMLGAFYGAAKKEPVFCVISCAISALQWIANIILNG